MWADIEALHRIVDIGIILLLHNLRTDVSESASRIGTTSLLETFYLDDKDLGRGIDLELLRDITVLFTYVAVPLIVTREDLLCREAIEAICKTDSLFGASTDRFIFLLSASVVLSKLLLKIIEIELCFCFR